VYRSAEGRPERLSHLANELLESHPDVLVAGFGTLAAKAAKEATTTVPVIFGDVGDPVGAGLVASLNRPGGNVTGLSTQGADLAGKRLQLLQEVSGAAKIFGVLLNPQTPLAALALDQLRAAAEKAGTDLKVFEITAGDQLVSQVEAAANAGVAALMAVDDPLMMSLVAQLAQLAQKHRLPTLSSTRVFTEAGGLISYGPDRRKAFRRAAEYAYRIISGMNPADLAVEQPTMFEMVINLKTAATLGVTIPPTLLARADEVIE